MKKNLLLLLAIVFTFGNAMSQVVKNVNCENAGSLRTLLTSEEFNTVTNLSVSGQIDSRDFSVFVDMSGTNALRTLNLSEVTVVQYTSSYGTIYPANTIGENAFRNSFLDHIQLPISVTKISKDAFYNLPSLKSIDLPTSLISIGATAFIGCSGLTAISLPNSLQTIGKYAFANCIGLTEVSIPEQTSKIWGGAFKGCTNLTHINVVASNSNYASVDGILFSKDNFILFAYPRGRSGSYAFPSNLQQIADSAFIESTNLIGSLNFPTTLKKIGANAFFGCSNVNSTISLPEGLIEIGKNAFSGCSQLTGNLLIPSTISKLGVAAFSACSSLSSLDFKAPIDTIPEYAFYDCSSLANKITLPGGLKVIDKYAFMGCSSVSELDLPASLSEIRDFAFYNLNAIIQLSIPENVQTVGPSAFASANSLTKLILPNNLNLGLYEYAFSDCSALQIIENHSDQPTFIMPNTFNNVDKSTCIVYVPVGKVSAYRNYNNWNVFVNIVEYDNGYDPNLTWSYPSQNKQGFSRFADMILNFNESVSVKKSMLIVNTATNAIIKTITPAEFIVKDSVLRFDMEGYLEAATTYSLKIPSGFVEDGFVNIWPANDYDLVFTTAAKRGEMDMRFPPEGILVGDFDVPYYAKEDGRWTTTSIFEENGTTKWQGYFSWTMFGLPLRWYGDVVPTDYMNNYPGMDEEDSPINNLLWMTRSGDKVVVDLSKIDNVVTNITSAVYENNCEVEARYYFGDNYYNQIATKTFPEDFQKMHFENTNFTKLDSIVYTSLEGNVRRILIELIDLAVPVVELGANRTICAGDSIRLDGGMTPGAMYIWSTGERTKSIWVKTSGDYSLTVKNTLGERTDNVTVIVKPQIQLNLPDTIQACVGEKIVLTAGIETNYNYLWSPTGETSPFIEVTQSGLYEVLVNNGGCYAADSVRVIFQGAALNAFYLQGGMAAYDDVYAELYKKNLNGNFVLLRTDTMPQFVHFDSLASGDYILKAHFAKYSFVGENPYLDTYHDGEIFWENVSPFHLTCVSDTTLSFLLASKPTSYNFNGTSSISGVLTTYVSLKQSSIDKNAVDQDYTDAKAILYDADNNHIATADIDSNEHYIFSNLPAANYKVGIERTGFALESKHSITLSSGQSYSAAYFTLNQTDFTISPGLNSGLEPSAGSRILEMSVYPNPIENIAHLHINLKNANKLNICLVDILGKTVQSEVYQMHAGDNILQIPINQKAGIYFLKLESAEGMAIKRIIIQ
jgi:hypothetical protein